MQETRVQPLGREDPLEKEMATHSSILAWKIPWTEEPGGLQWGGKRSRQDLVATQQQQYIHTTMSFKTSFFFPEVLFVINNNIWYSVIINEFNQIQLNK